MNGDWDSDVIDDSDCDLLMLYLYMCRVLFVEGAKLSATRSSRAKKQGTSPNQGFRAKMSPTCLGTKTVPMDHRD